MVMLRNGSNKQYKMMMAEFPEFAKNTELGLCLLNRDFKIVWANRKQTKWVGPLKKICGKHCYETFERNPRICKGCPVLVTFQTGKPAHSEPRTAYTKNGKIGYFSVSATPIKDKGGRVEAVLEIVRNITNKKMLEDERRRLLTAMAAVTDFVIIVDMHKKILYVNDAFELKMGFTKEELIGNSGKMFISDKNPKDMIRKTVNDLVVKGEWQGEGWIRKKDGTNFLAHVNLSVAKDKNGKPFAFVGISRDITKEKEQAKDLAEKTSHLKLLNKRLWLTNQTIRENAIKLNEANQNIKILNKSLEEKVRDRTKELQLANEEVTTLYTIGKKMVSTLNLDEVLGMIVKTVSVMMDAEASSVRLFDDNRENLVLKAHCGLDEEYAKQFKYIKPAKDSLKAIEGKTPYTVTKMGKGSKESYQARLSKDGFTNFVFVPIIFNNESLGVISAISRKGRMFLDREVSLLHAFASHAAIAINNAKMHEATHLNYYNTITTLSLAMEARDPYTRGHAERVTNYSLSIAKTLNLSPEEIDVLRYSGKVHDIGKIGISDLLLLKPGKLTPEERAQIELHPIKGVEIVSNLKFMEPCIPIVRHHHERYDGMGYPDRLKAYDIPIGARILSVADAFDAMTSARPYRNALTFEEAVDELKRHSGKQFDPDIVNAFLKMTATGLSK